MSTDDAPVCAWLPLIRGHNRSPSAAATTPPPMAPNTVRRLTRCPFFEMTSGPLVSLAIESLHLSLRGKVTGFSRNDGVRRQFLLRWPSERSEAPSRALSVLESQQPRRSAIKYQPRPNPH